MESLLLQQCVLIVSLFSGFCGQLLPSNSGGGAPVGGKLAFAGLVTGLGSSVAAHHSWNFRQGSWINHDFAEAPGLYVSFEHPVYTNGYFLGFDAWDNINFKYGTSNITWIVRVEFQRSGFRENRIKRHYKRFWLPGTLWVELSTQSNHIYRANITHVKERNYSHVDLWVTPKCFLRHNGISRIHRVAKSMKLNVDYLRWMAKINYGHDEEYGARELIEVGKAMTNSVSGIQCTWVHPRIPSSFATMIRFDRDSVPSKSFFSPIHGYNNWNFLNNEYQVPDIKFIRGWNRALLSFEGGLSCAESPKAIARRYQSLPSIRSVHLDALNDCKFTYQIIIAFDRKIMSPDQVLQYHHWKGLNHLYGVVNLNLKFRGELKAVLEFEPGLYSHFQMKAIRDEYLKLPGIKFGWVTGKMAGQIANIILHFSRSYLKRVPLRAYTLWSELNKRYLTNITIVEESKGRAFLRFPEDKFSDLELKYILRKYRQLPGIASVRMDLDSINHAPHWSNTSTSSSQVSHPPQRTLKSWMLLSNGDGSRLLSAAEAEGDDAEEGAGTLQGKQCINNN